MIEYNIEAIKKRWEDRFSEIESPTPNGMQKIGYVVDIYNLLKQIPKWNDIESIPKNGRWVLACGENFSHAYLAQYHNKYGIIDYEGNKVSGNTHWMELPELPASDKDS